VLMYYIYPIWGYPTEISILSLSSSSNRNSRYPDRSVGISLTNVFTKGLPSMVFMEFKSSLNVRFTDDQTREKGGGGGKTLCRACVGPSLGSVMDSGSPGLIGYNKDPDRVLFP